MKSKRMTITAGVLAVLAAISGTATSATQDKYTLKVPGGLAFSEFRGYESWQLIAISQHGDIIAGIFGNPVMIDAFKAGIPENGQPFPDGAKMAKVHWNTRKNDAAPGQPTVTGTLHDVDFMVKDSKRFADGHGWGYGVFEHDQSSSTFRPGNLKDMPPQANDAKCGVACHMAAQSRDYVFTQYAAR